MPYVRRLFASDGSHIGNVRIGYINWLYKTAEISLVVLEQSCSGQGLGFEMVHAATNYAFRVLKLEKIEAGCMAANKASLRVFEKAGYKKEGLIRESIVLNGERADYFLLGILKVSSSNDRAENRAWNCSIWSGLWDL